jgi:hypothetical protein
LNSEEPFGFCPFRMKTVDLRLRQIETQVQLLEELKSGLSTGPIKKLQADLRRGAPIPSWIEKFPNRATAQESSKKLNDMRARLALLWERALQEEPTRATEFGHSSANLTRAVKNATELPPLLPELSELRRSLEEFSAPLQRTLRSHVEEAFRAFRERIANVQLLTDYIKEIELEIDRAHRRIFGQIDFEELLARAGVARRWASLRDFPEAAKASAFRAAKSCVAEIYKLQARQQRMMAERETRAAEIYRALESDVAAGVAEAQRAPGRQDCWDEIVALDKRFGTPLEP